mmetsp:Transcript_37376/g.107312  ORF Transcript_37376/g.107312 Transcript_37376/m.107312 type:complete len:94 (+) Transcript_37376:2-283(+)
MDYAFKMPCRFAWLRPLSHKHGPLRATLLAAKKFCPCFALRSSCSRSVCWGNLFAGEGAQDRQLGRHLFTYNFLGRLLSFFYKLSSLFLTLSF